MDRNAEGCMLRKLLHWLRHGQCALCLKEFRRRDLYRDPADIVTLCADCLAEIDAPTKAT